MLLPIRRSEHMCRNYTFRGMRSERLKRSLLWVYIRLAFVPRPGLQAAAQEILSGGIYLVLKTLALLKRSWCRYTSSEAPGAPTVQWVCDAGNPTPQTGFVTAILSKLEMIDLPRTIAFFTDGSDNDAS